jgi:hypothetical protein
MATGLAGVEAAERPNLGYTVSPVFREVQVKAGQAQARHALTLRNRSAVSQTFRLSAVNFGALDESGGVAFLGQEGGGFERKYGLAAWMKLEQDLVTVPAGGSLEIAVAVNNSDTLAPGGHYGAVLATADTDAGGVGAAAGGGSSPEPRVGVKQVLSSLVLLVKEGGGAADLRLVSQGVTARWWAMPEEVRHRFLNAGNVHVVPRGVVEVKDPTGRVVARGALNEGSGMVLPESHRRYTTPMVRLASAWLPGRYTATTTYRYDGTEDTKTFTTTFWYGGGPLAWVALGLVLVGAIAAIRLLRKPRLSATNS